MPSTRTDLHVLTATEALELLRHDVFTVEEYAKALLARVKERDEDIGAWAYLDESLVLSQARALDARPHAERGPLHGLAVGVKDNMNTAGSPLDLSRCGRNSSDRETDMPTQHGSSLYLNHRSNVDSSPVSILRSAGALIFGKTTTPEFTVLNSGPSTANPHDKARTPGGSSTGSAAAVADFQVPLSIGTQNGGSIVRPASYSGIFAMKPTHNLISAEGVKMVSFNLDTCGFFARCIEDIQLVAQIFNVRSAILPGKKPIDQLKVAFVKSPFWDMAGPGTVSAMDTAARVLCAHGVSVEEPELPWELGDATLLEQTHNMVLRAEARSAFLMEYRMEGAREKLDQYVIDMVENKDEYTLDDTILAVKRYADMRTAFDKFASQYDAIITPSAVDIAPLGLDDMGPYIFNFLWTGLHGPAMHIPAFVGAEGMPVGISVVQSRYQDQRLLAHCQALCVPLMAEGGWSARLSQPSSKM